MPTRTTGLTYSQFARLLWPLLMASALPAAAAGQAASTDAAAGRASLEWPMFGQNWANTANGLTAALRPETVSKLKPKWVFTTQGDVSARAAVVGGGAYFPDFGGYLYRVSAR